MSERVGFIGLGAMGGAIAARLLQRGIDVLGFDIDAGAADRLRCRGGAVASSPREIADKCEIVFACLPTPEICQAVALGPGGVAGGSSVRIYAETSTIGGEVVRQMATGLKAAGVGLPGDGVQRLPGPELARQLQIQLPNSHIEGAGDCQQTVG